MVGIIFNAPLWLTGTLLVLALSGFALGAQRVVRRWVMPRFRLRPHESEYPATIIASVMVFYGLVAALVAITVWERHTLVAERVAGEASAIASVWRDLGGYPAPERDALRDMLRGYTEYLIHDAWPEYRRGRVPPEGVDWLDRFQERLLGFEPVSESQKILHSETLRSYNQMILVRRLRLDAVGTGLPGLIWTMVLLGALITIVISLLFPIEDSGYQAVMMVGLSCLIALVILVILGLDQPFRGDLGVSSESFRLVHDHLMMR